MITYHDDFVDDLNFIVMFEILYNVEEWRFDWDNREGEYD